MRFIILLAFLSFYFSPISGQCPLGNVLIDSEEMAVSFMTTYPNCSIINGHLTIGPKDGLGKTRTEKVIGLSNIKEVTGNLIIQNNPWMVEVPDIWNIETVGGDFVIDQNEELKGLLRSKVTSIGGKLRFTISHNQDFYIQLNSLKEIGGNLQFYPKQARWSYFPALERVGGDINIFDQPGDIKILDDFHALREVRSVIFRMGYQDLSIDAFGNLEKIESISINVKTEGPIKLGNTIPVEFITIYESSEKLSIPAFQDITSLKGLNCYQMKANDLRLFPNLKKVGFLLLSDTHAPWTSTSMPGVNMLDSVGTAILHGQCLQFIPFLPQITKKLQIRGRLDNDNLAYLDQCRLVKEVSINSSYIKEIIHPFSITTDVFTLENLSQLKSLDHWDISGIHAKEIRINSTAITSLDLLKGSLQDSCKLIFNDNKYLTECGFVSPLCDWFKKADDGTANIIFKGKNGPCTKATITEHCDK